MEESAQLQTPIAVMGSSRPEPDITKWSMDPKQLFIQLGHDLRGETPRRGPHGEEWFKAEDAKSMLNEAGITWLFAVLRPVVDKYAMQANINEERANRIALTTAKLIIDGLRLNKIDFKLSNKHYISVMILVFNIIDFAVTRPIGGEERRAMHESSEVHRYYTGPEMQQQQKGGLRLPIIGSLFQK